MVVKNMKISQKTKNKSWFSIKKILNGLFFVNDRFMWF